MIQFFELCVIVLILYLITQILIPAIWPKDFERNWLFKRKKRFDDKVQDLTEKKGNLNNQIAETKQKLMDEADRIANATKDIEKI